MAKGQKTGGRDFPPGVSGNPAGRPPTPPDVRAAREMNRFELERLFNEALNLSKEELKERYRDPKTPAKERMVLQLVRSACWGGNVAKIQFIISQLCPAPKPGAPGAPGARDPHSFVELVRQAEAAKRKSDE